MTRICLAHGAFGTPDDMAPWLEGLAARDLVVSPIALPRGRAERAVDAFAAQVPDEPRVVIGGHSMGGRAALLLAAGAGPSSGGTAARRHPVAGVVAMSFPLHPPRRPDPGLARAAHWPAVSLPVLLLSGDADPYARIDLLRDAVARLTDARLTVYPGLGHDLAAVREDALDRIARFAREVVTG